LPLATGREGVFETALTTLGREDDDVLDGKRKENGVVDDVVDDPPKDNADIDLEDVVDGKEKENGLVDDVVDDPPKDIELEDVVDGKEKENGLVDGPPKDNADIELEDVLFVFNDGRGMAVVEPAGVYCLGFTNVLSEDGLGALVSLKLHRITLPKLGSVVLTRLENTVRSSQRPYRQRTDCI